MVFKVPIHLESIRKTDGGDVSIAGKVHKAVNLDHGEVIVEVTGVVVGVDLHAEDIKLHVGEELAVIVHIPLSQPHPKLLWPDTMRQVYISRAQKSRSGYDNITKT